MQINSASTAYSSAFDALRSRGESRGTGAFQAAMKDDASSANPSAAGVTASGSGLLSHMTSQTIFAQDEDDPYLSVATRHHVQDLVSDSGYAMKYAEKYASNPIAVMIKMPVPADGKEGWVDPKIVQDSFDRWTRCMTTVQSVHDNAQSLFEQGKLEGKSGAEIYADILGDQLSQPDAYWKARDPDRLSGNLKASVQAELTALQKAMAAAAPMV